MFEPTDAMSLVTKTAQENVLFTWSVWCGCTARGRVGGGGGGAEGFVHWS